MAVSLRGENATVAQEGADNIKVYASLHQAGGKGVPAGVEYYIRSQVQGCGSLLEPHGQPAIVYAGKGGRQVPAPHQDRQGRRGHRYRPCL